MHAPAQERPRGDARVYLCEQGAMVGVTVGPVHKPKSSAPFLRPPSRQRPFFKPDRASLPLARNIGLGPHLSDYKPPPGAAVRPAEAPFEDTPVRILEPLVYGMSDHEQAAIIGPFQALWLRASPGGCFVVDPLRGGETGIGPLTKAVMETVDPQALLQGVKWRQDVGADILTDLLKRFRGLAVPLGQQRGVCLAGVCDELTLGEGKLYVNRPTTFSAADGGDSAPEPLIPGGVGLHNDEVLESSLFRLMELWKGACPTAAGGGAGNAPRRRPQNAFGRSEFAAKSKNGAPVRDFGPPPRLSERPGRPARGRGPARRPPPHRGLAVGAGLARGSSPTLASLRRPPEVRTAGGGG